MADKQVVPFLVGPTASGKTAVSLLLAEKLNAKIISADSRQLYRGMEIGTAQPAQEELARVPHHFVGCLDPETNFSAGEYGRLARAKIEELSSRKRTALVVGGSGLYISALVDDFFNGPPSDPEIRNRLKTLAGERGVHRLFQDLEKIDPAAAKKIMPNDYRRIERALEIYYLTGLPISAMRKQKANPPPYRPVMVGIDRPRDQLYDRINHRCLEMLEAGLVDEVKGLLYKRNLSASNCNALNSVGYSEVIQYLKGQVDYAEMVRLFQRNSRRFAKRQIGWFKRDQRITWIETKDEVAIEETVTQVLDVYAGAGIESQESWSHS